MVGQNLLIGWFTICIRSCLHFFLYWNCFQNYMFLSSVFFRHTLKTIISRLPKNHSSLCKWAIRFRFTLLHANKHQGELHVPQIHLHKIRLQTLKCSYITDEYAWVVKFDNFNWANSRQHIRKEQQTENTTDLHRVEFEKKRFYCNSALLTQKSSRQKWSDHCHSDQNAELFHA